MFDLRHRLEFIINSDVSGNHFKLGFNGPYDFPFVKTFINASLSK
jgi:hypothetical protein